VDFDFLHFSKIGKIKHNLDLMLLLSKHKSSNLIALLNTCTGTLRGVQEYLRRLDFFFWGRGAKFWKCCKLLKQRSLIAY